jgi:outer membrane protein assembly factor BamD
MRSVCIIAAVTLFFVSCAARQTLTPIEPEAEFERAQSFYENKKYNQAIDAFERILFYHPSSGYVDDAQYWLGRAYLEKREYDQAVVEFDYLIRNFPNSAQLEEAYFFRAKAYILGAPGHHRDLSDLEKAIRFLDEFLTRFPNSQYTDDARKEILSARNRLAKKELENGKLYIKLKEPDAALLYFNYIMNAYPETEAAREAKFRSARIYEKQGPIPQAIDLYKELLEDSVWQDQAAKRIRDLEKGG